MLYIHRIFMKPYKIFIKARRTLPHTTFVNVKLRNTKDWTLIETLYNENGDAVAAYTLPKQSDGKEGLQYFHIPLTEIYRKAVKLGAEVNKAHGADLWMDEGTARAL